MFLENSPNYWRQQTWIKMLEIDFLCWSRIDGISKKSFQKLNHVVITVLLVTDGDDGCTHFQGLKLICGNSAYITRKACYNWHSPSTVIRLLNVWVKQSCKNLIKILKPASIIWYSDLEPKKKSTPQNDKRSFRVENPFDVLSIRWKSWQRFSNYEAITIMICFSFVWLSLRG